jgi:hypothetical protein
MEKIYNFALEIGSVAQLVPKNNKSLICMFFANPRKSESASGGKDFRE